MEEIRDTIIETLNYADEKLTKEEFDMLSEDIIDYIEVLKVS